MVEGATMRKTSASTLLIVCMLGFASLFFGCNDVIETMAQVQLTVRMDDHQIPLSSSFTLYGTKQGSRTTIEKQLGALNETTLLPLEPGVWDLRVEARVGGILKGTGATAVAIKAGKQASAIIDLSYEYDVTFDANGGSSPSITGKDVVYDAQYGPLASTSKVGYTFLGWYTAAVGGTKVEESTKFTQTSNQTLYAHWQANTYTVTFDVQSGSGGTSETSATYDSSLTPSLSAPSRVGYTFGGYYDQVSGQGIQYYDASMNGQRTWDKAGAATLYAKWTATITFDGDGATTSANPSTRQIIDTQSTDTLGSAMPQDPQRSGYSFAGWYTQQEGNGTEFTGSSEVTGSQTVYAKWTSTVTFDSQAADTAATPSSYTITETSVSDTLSQLPTDPVKNGYTFAGWYTAVSGGGDAFTTSSEVAGNRTVYAKWTALVTYDVSDATTAPNPTTKTIVYSSGNDTVQSLPTEPQKTRYVFTGWYTAANGGGTSFTADTLVTGHITVYPRWASQVTFDSRSADTDASPSSKLVYQTSGCDKVGTLPADPIRAGYTFDHWYTAANGSGSLVSSDTQVAGEVTFYAKWNANTDTPYTVEHYQQPVSGSDYVKVDTDTLSGTTDTLATAIAKTSYTGLAENSTHPGRVASGNIAGNGSLVLKLYYDRTLHTVQFDANEGSSVADITNIRYGATIGAPDEPTRTGYTFGGWYKENTLNTLHNFTTDTITADTTLYAKWTANSYTVSFDKQEGNGGSDYVEASYAAAMPDANKPVRAGYTFTGYYDATTGGNQYYDASMASVRSWDKAGNTDLYARWTANTDTPYTVKHYQQPVSGSDYVKVDTDTLSGTTDTLATAIAKTSYTGFAENSTHPERVASGNIAGNGSLVLKLYYDRTLHTVQFDANEGSSVADITNIRYGATIGAPDEPTRTGYTFGGWYKENTLNTLYNFTTDTITADTTLYAKWDANTYTVSFDAEGGEAVTSMDVTYDETYGTLPTTSRTGYTFVNWMTGDNGTGSEVTAGTKVTITDDAILYAKWGADTYTVSFDAEGGDAVTSMDVTYDETYGTLPTTSRSGYTFVNWMTGDNGTGSEVTEGTKVTITADATLYAKWDANTDTPYTVEHYQQPVSGSDYVKVDTDTLSGTTDTLATALAKTSYTGFAENSTHPGRVASGNIAGNGSLVLKLYYDRTLHTVQFDANEGSSVADITNIRYGATIGTPIEPTRTGYTFGGWYKENTLNTLHNFTTDTITADTTLYAKWHPDSTVTFNSNGGSSVDSLTSVPYNTKITAPTEPTKSMQVFVGWSKDEDTTTPWYFTEDTVKQDITLYAKWRDYQVRDIGPAGGYIFYDDEADGVDDIPDARYLEAAPASTNTSGINWGITGPLGTLKALGEGENNTAILVGLKGSGSYYPAGFCNNLQISHNGVTFTDWFLPSIEELELMERQLYQYGLGGFNTTSYWSSSETEDGRSVYARAFRINPVSWGASKWHPDDDYINIRAIRAF